VIAKVKAKRRMINVRNLLNQRGQKNKKKLSVNLKKKVYHRFIKLNDSSYSQ
jgi:hypothetical protein